MVKNFSLFNDFSPRVLLSTQINYNPSFLVLTQPNDRKNFILANSIDNPSDKLSFLNSIFYQNLDYNFTAFATSVGMDFFFNQFLNQPRIFNESLNEGQILYKIQLMKPLNSSFRKLNENDFTQFLPPKIINENSVFE